MSACNAGDLGSISGLGHGKPLQYSCLKNPHGQRSLAGYGPWGHKEPDMTKQLSTRIKRASLVAQLVRNLLAMQETAVQETQVQSLGQADPLEKATGYPL